MTTEEKLALLDSAAAAASDFVNGFTGIEQVLRAVLPIVPVFNTGRDKSQRVSLGWDGVHIVNRKPLALPVPTDAELYEAVMGLLQDIRTVLS